MVASEARDDILIARSAIVAGRHITPEGSFGTEHPHQLRDSRPVMSFPTLAAGHVGAVFGQGTASRQRDDTAPVG